ncbi:MAG: nucleotidyltransferase domain-containing protein [Candidatus Edwardsbacteria bacterium]
MISSEIEDILQATVDAFRRHLQDRLVAVGIFGSIARKETTPSSDIDFLLLATSLPTPKFKRELFIREPLIGIIPQRFNVLAWTKEEFERNFPSIYLDLAQDTIVLYDPENYLQNKLNIIREITRKAGLVRVKLNGGFRWKWEDSSKYRNFWSLTWEGYRELKR